jgi:protease-4
VITSTGDGFSRLLGLGTLSSADDFVYEIKAADSDDTIDAIIIDIDSPGGIPVAADEMMSALIETNKPVVAVIRSVGASAAYWVAAGADRIIASPVSQVGSVGVTMSYLETASSTDIVGSRWIDISSGLYKDAGNPERALRDEERAHFRAQVASVHEYMVDRIAEARRVFTREEVAQLADGRAYVGTEALRLKLVDALGGVKDAEQWIAETLEKQTSEVVRCGQEGTVFGDLF